MTDQKRCQNCNKPLKPRVTNGKTEHPNHFKKRRFCSKICGAVANAAQRKLICDAEMRAKSGAL